MPSSTLNILKRFETWVKAGKISGFNVVMQRNEIVIRSSDNTREEQVELDKETAASLKIFFHGVDKIEYDSFDYVSLTSIINAKLILDRMLHKNDSKK